MTSAITSVARRSPLSRAPAFFCTAGAPGAAAHTRCDKARRWQLRRLPSCQRCCHRRGTLPTRQLRRDCRRRAVALLPRHGPPRRDPPRHGRPRPARRGRRLLVARHGQRHRVVRAHLAQRPRAARGRATRRRPPRRIDRPRCRSSRRGGRRWQRSQWPHEPQPHARAPHRPSRAQAAARAPARPPPPRPVHNRRGAPRGAARRAQAARRLRPPGRGRMAASRLPRRPAQARTTLSTGLRRCGTPRGTAPLR